MSTTALPVKGDSLETKILKIINLAMQAASMVVPGSTAAIALGGTLIHALQAYEAEVGEPIDLNKIPQEAPVA